MEVFACTIFDPSLIRKKGHYINLFKRVFVLLLLCTVVHVPAFVAVCVSVCVCV